MPSARFGGELPRPVTVLLVSDEEVGSASSRPITEGLAKQSAGVLVLEPSFGPKGAVKTARKGIGAYTLKVTGKAAHSGLDFEQGQSAILEMARQITRISGLVNLEARPHLECGPGRRGHAGECDTRGSYGQAGCSSCAPAGCCRHRPPAAFPETLQPPMQARDRGRNESSADGADPGRSQRSTARRSESRSSSAGVWEKPRSEAVPTATSPPDWESPRSTDWAESAKVHMPPTSPS